MKNHVVGLKRRLSLLLQPKAILVGLAAFNFAVFYVEAKRAEEFPGIGYCFGAPWYISHSTSNFPLLLLAAAVGLCVRKWWSYLAAIALSAPVAYQGAGYLLTDRSIDYVWALLWYEPSLLLQYALAVVLMVTAAVGAARQVRR